MVFKGRLWFIEHKITPANFSEMSPVTPKGIQPQMDMEKALWDIMEAAVISTSLSPTNC